MAVSSNTVTHFNGNSAISFRALQTTFGGNANSIKFSTYKRNTNLDETDPIVPDATENANISTTDSNLQLGAFRGSIKQYILTQTGSNTTLDIDSQSWNSNLSRNVIKQFQINGTISATTNTDTAGSFNAEAYNMRFVVNGDVYGVGGAGGIANGGNGGNGGDALEVTNSSSRTGTSARVQIDVLQYGKIWAGGGGGGAGSAGNSGSDLPCYYESNQTQTIYSGGSTNPTRACNIGCSDGTTTIGEGWTLYSNGDCFGQGGDRKRCRKANMERGAACRNQYTRNCTYRFNFTVGAGTGGNGGNGGDGQGVNTTQGLGNPGNFGNTNSCAANGNNSTGNRGNDGAYGGTWGEAGGNSAGNGGSAGRAIFGSKYSVSGANINNVKGSY